MTESRFSEEQVIGMIKEQEAGLSTAEVCRKHGLSPATFYKLKAKYGGLEVSEAWRLRLRNMRQFAASLLLGFLSACGSAPYRPLPPMADKLPSDVRNAEPEFDRRVKAAFPLGSSEEKAITELGRLGFEASPQGADGYRSADIKRGGMICQTLWSVRWKAEAGQLREIFGVYGFRCP